MFVRGNIEFGNLKKKSLLFYRSQRQNKNRPETKKKDDDYIFLRK